MRAAARLLPAQPQLVLGALEVWMHVLETPREVEARGRTHEQVRTVVQPVPGDAVQDALDGRAVCRHDQCRPAGDEDPAQQVPVLGVGGVPHRLDRATVAGEPVRCSSVQVRERPRILDPQPVTKHLAQECVVAEPLSAGPEPDDERVRALECLEALLPVRCVGEGFGEPAAQPLRDGGPQQETLHVGWLARQHLTHEVVGDGLVVACEARWVTCRVALEEEGREPHARRPSLRTSQQQSNVVGRNGDPVRGEHGGRVGLVEGEVTRTDLVDVVGHPHAVQRERRVGTSDDDEPQLLQRVLQQGRDAFEHAGFVDDVEVVEHDDHRVRQLLDAGQETLEAGRLAPETWCELGQRVAGWDVEDSLQGRDEAGPERPWFVVGRVQRDPGDGRGGGRGPGCRGQGLAPSGPGADDRQGTFGALVEQRIEVRAHHEARGCARARELGSEALQGRGPRRAELTSPWPQHCHSSPVVPGTYVGDGEGPESSATGMLRETRYSERCHDALPGELPNLGEVPGAQHGAWWVPAVGRSCRCLPRRSRSTCADR